MFKVSHRPGDWIQFIETRAYNRTGATIERGQVAMCDILRTQAETTSNLPGGTGPGTSCWDNMTPVTQASLNNGFPVFVAMEQIADNQPGRWCVCGVLDVAVCDDDVSTTDIDRGDPVSMLVSESAVAVQAFANGNRFLGIAQEDAAASSADTDDTIDASTHRRLVYWVGGLPSCNIDA